MTQSILKHNIWKASVVTAIFILVAEIIAFRSGNYLVVNHPERSDVIVVLAGDHNDLRYWRGLQLLREHYGRRMLVDAQLIASTGAAMRNMPLIL